MSCFCNGYVYIYNPSHHFAFSNGCVYEHIIKAEEKLGRELKEGEVVHHIDHNRSNNNLNNLMIFDSISSHTAYHMGCEAYLIGDVWHCDKMKSYCPLCGKEKDKGAKLCIECYNKNHLSKIPKKEELIKHLIEDCNFVKTAKRYNVTDNAVRKWCKKYELPYHTKELKECINNGSLAQLVSAIGS